MAITETSPAAAVTDAASAADGDDAVVSGLNAPAPGGLAGLFGTGDHKSIGRLYIGFSLLFGVIALGLAAAFTAAGVSADWADRVADSAFRLYSLSRFLLVLGFVVPLFVGIATVVVPLQVGAATVAFPRAAASAFWLWLLSALVLIAASLADGGGILGPVGAASRNAQILTFVALIGLVGSLLLGAICVATTAIAYRPNHMSLDQVPVFSWAMVVAAGIWALSLGVWVGNVVLVLADAKYGRPAQFGAATNIWPELAWLVDPPQLFAFAIPVLGIAGDAVATASGGRLRSRSLLLGAIGVYGILSFGAFVQPYFLPNAFRNWLFVGMSALVILPLLILLGGYGASMRSGRPKLHSPALFALTSMLLLLLAGVSAIPFAIGRLSLQYTPKALMTLQPIREAATDSGANPIFTWGMFLLVVGVAATGAVGGIYLWSTKVTGRVLGDGLGKLLALLLPLAGLLTGLPFMVLAAANRVDSLADSAQTMYSVSVAGTLLLALLVLVVAVLLAVSPLRDAAGAPDPWGSGTTLEWASDSPPGTGNFQPGAVPVVLSAEPLLDEARREES